MVWTSRWVIWLSTALLIHHPAAQAQDPVPLYPGNYKVVLENDRVRVLDFQLTPGARETAHQHPAHVLYVLAPFKVRFTFPDGSTRIRDVKAGEVLFSEPVIHATENIGGTMAHGLLVELKAASARGASLGAGVGTSAAGLLTAVTFIHGREGQAEQLQRDLLALTAPTLAEPGAITYDLYQSKENENEFLRFEVWKDSAALEAHKATPHLRASFEKRLREGWTTDITLWTAISADSIVAGGPGTPSVEGRITRLDPRFDRLLPSDARLELVVDGHEWAEGPVWDRKLGCLLFSDVIRNAAYRWCEGRGEEVFLQASGYTGAEAFAGKEPGSNGLAFDNDGRLLLAEHGDRRIVRLERDGHKTVLVDRYQGKRINSPNDLIVLPNGDLLFTDPPWGLPRWWDDPGKELRVNGVYRRSVDGTVTLLTGELQAPNGLALSPDGQTLFVSESKPGVGAWYAFAMNEDGSLGARRTLLDAVPWTVMRKGVPDGLKLDRESHLFGGGPGGVYVIDPDGTLLGIIETGGPASNVAWGNDGSVLYVTAGARVFRIHTTTRGAGW